MSKYSAEWYARPFNHVFGAAGVLATGASLGGTTLLAPLGAG